MEDGIGYSNYIQVKKKKALDSRAKKENKLAICFTQKRLLQTYKGGCFLFLFATTILNSYSYSSRR